MSDHCMVSPDVILETSHIFIAIIQLLFSTRIRRLDFKCLVFPEPRHVRDVCCLTMVGLGSISIINKRTIIQAIYIFEIVRKCSESAKNVLFTISST